MVHNDTNHLKLQHRIKTQDVRRPIVDKMHWLYEYFAIFFNNLEKYLNWLSSGFLNMWKSICLCNFISSSECFQF